MNENEIKVSVIMALYNSAQFMRTAIESVINQTLTEKEIILVDDASPDNSYDIANEYMQTYPNIIHVIHHEKNKRAGGARNDGLKMAKGEYIWFVDADDWLAKDALEKMYNKAKEANYDVVSSDFYEVEDENTIKENVETSIPDEATGSMDTAKRLLYITNGTAGFSKLIKREYLIKNRLFYPENVMFEDNGIVPLFGGMANSVARVHEGLYYYRIGNDQSQTRTKKTEKVLSDRREAEKYLLEKAKENHVFEELQPALEYVYVLTSYISIVRFFILGQCDLSKQFFTEIKKDAHERFPKFMKNEYIKKMSKGSKIALYLSELGYYSVILAKNTKKIIRGEK